MAYNPIYTNQTNASGERVSTNGYYTGHHKGSILQDAKGDNVPYSVELNSVHVGTIIQDSSTGSMPDVGVKFVQNLTECTSSNNESIVAKGKELKVTYTASTEHVLPSTITVKIGGVIKTVTTDYTFASGVLTIQAAKVTGDVEVTVTATSST